MNSSQAAFDTRAHGSRYRGIIVAGFVMFVLITGAIYVSGYAEDAGWQIPQENVANDYLIGVIWSLMLAFLISAWPVRSSDKENLIVGWLAKCYVGLIVMLPYEQHYDLDCFGYFQSMRWTNYEWSWDPKYRSALVVNGIGWTVGRAMDSYHAIKMTFALIGFVAIYLVYRAAIAVIGRERPQAFLCFVLFPSVLFWSSILGKDPVVFFGVALYVYGVALWRARRKPQYLVALAAGIAIATVMRTWLGVILGLPLLYFMIRGVRGFLQRLITVIICILLVTYMLNVFASTMDISSAEDLVSRTDKIAHQFSNYRGDAAGSTRDAGAQVTSIASMIAFMPVGAFTVLFRPLPFEVNNAFGFLSGVENLALLCLTLMSIFSIVKDRAVRRPLMREPVILWAILLIVIWCWSYGFISVQNLGASVRYRLPIIAVVVGLLLAVRWVKANVRASVAAQRDVLQKGTKPIVT
jgi:hypothetical protein